MGTHGIGIIGAGTIVRAAHLPAYMASGLQVVGIFDADQARCANVANEFGIRSFRDLDELLGEGRVTIVDIAVTPHAQKQLAVEAALAGKHVLAQKPLAPSLEDAIAMVKATRSCTTSLAVNQQMRWEGNTASAKQLIASGELGEPIAYMINTNMSADFPANHWLARESRLMALYGAIHNVDAARYLFGEPNFVSALLARDPLQLSRGELWINAWLEWDSGVTMTLNERYTNWAGDLRADVRLEGTKGTLRGTFGLWDDYPNPHPGTTEFKRHGDPAWTQLQVGATWIPDAFAGPMFELIEAADSGRSPSISWEDNLRSLAIVEAMYESDRAGSRIQLDLERRMLDDE